VTTSAATRGFGADGRVGEAVGSAVGVGVAVGVALDVDVAVAAGPREPPPAGSSSLQAARPAREETALPRSSTRLVVRTSM
jgi:hypothetical protein